MLADTATVLKSKLIRDPDAAWRDINGEMIIVSPVESMMHALNDVAALVWMNADGKTTVREIVQRVCNDFDVDTETAEKDVVEFVRDLSEQGMVILSD